MGSFNYTGWYSKLPIHYGNRAVALIGVLDLTISHDEFAPGHKFTPIALPIRGIYNDYGGIYNIDNTAASIYISKFFNIDIEDLINKIVSDNIDDDIIKCILDKVNTMRKLYMHNINYSEFMNIFNSYKDEDIEVIKEKVSDIFNIADNDITIKKFTKRYKLKIILEHESIFDTLVSIGNDTLKDYHFWQVPSDLLISLGYTEEEKIGMHHGYPIVSYTHETLPELIRDCYIYNKDVYEANNINNRSCYKAMLTINDICKSINIDVPSIYNEKYYNYAFNKSLNIYQHNKDVIKSKYGDSYTSFIRDADINNNSIFYSNGYQSTKYLLAIYDNNDLLKNENEKELVDLVSLINAMKKAAITFDTSHYANESIPNNLYGILISNMLKTSISLLHNELSDIPDNQKQILENLTHCIDKFQKLCSNLKNYN